MGIYIVAKFGTDWSIFADARVLTPWSGELKRTTRQATNSIRKSQESCSQAVLGASMALTGENTTAWSVIQPPKQPSENWRFHHLPDPPKVNT